MTAWFVSPGDDLRTAKTMAAVFATMAALVATSWASLTKRKRKTKTGSRGTTTSKAMMHQCSKREGEKMCIALAGVWILAAAIAIAMEAYEVWGKWGYMAFCGGCASLYFIFPYIWTCSADRKLKWRERYITKANIWIAIFSFIGNYWYTHYFYRVLEVSWGGSNAIQPVSG